MKTFARLLTLTFFLMISFAGHASHVIGSSMTADYLGVDAQTGWHKYGIRLVLHRDLNGITLPVQANIIERSTNISFNIPQVNTFTAGSPCGTAQVAYHEYYGERLIDPGTYTGANFLQFTYNTCCMAPNINNLSNSASLDLTAEALVWKANANAQPTFIQSDRAIFTGQSATFPICSVDPDGDSLFIDFSHHKYSDFVTPLPWEVGYSTQAQLGPTGWHTVDQIARTVTVYSGVQQNAALKMRVREYRADTSGTMELIGVSFINQLYQFVPGGNPTIVAALDTAFTPNAFISDSVYVKFDFKVYTSTFRADSTQMVLTKGTDTAYVMAAYPTALAKQLLLTTDQLLAPGTWTLEVGYAKDSSAFSKPCGEICVDQTTFTINSALDSVEFVGGDTAYVGFSYFYKLNDYAQYLDSVDYTVNNGLLWNPTTDPTDSIEITWTLNPGEITALLYADGAVRMVQYQVVIEGIGLDEEPASIFTLYPNPTSDLVRLDGFSGSANYVLYSLTGEVVASGLVPSGHTLDLSGMASGTYPLRLTAENGTGQSTLIKR